MVLKEQHKEDGRANEVFEFFDRTISKHINTAKLLSRDIREDDLTIEWPDSNSVNINEISEELETNNFNLELRA
ncbi:8664_t:CDS:2, partial [Diversispora eburnea]